MNDAFQVAKIGRKRSCSLCFSPTIRGFGVIETVIRRFTGLVREVMRCTETDLDIAAVLSAEMDSRGMVLEFAMLDFPEFAGCDNALFQGHLIAPAAPFSLLDLSAERLELCATRLAKFAEKVDRSVIRHLSKLKEGLVRHQIRIDDPSCD